MFFIDSERSEECIDFTMMYVFFFVSLYSITSRNNAPISNYGGGFRCKSEYSWCIIETTECFDFFEKFFLKIHRHNFFSLAFEIQILTKIRQKQEYLQIIFISRRYLKILPVIEIGVFFSSIKT
ncbi:Uncharacterized protein FWK35_00000285 [Aphis craccivora]|uniref:Uncharacterized protein n=1 Tax=Aphis craccivora TaxID=307492 RepID=A0A6G0ZLM7_APHCR|nr:Uncharacterized protein FWK35_00000285 [Aphis craccivora]